MGGLEVLGWIRKQEKFKSTIVVPLSSSNLPQDIEKACAAGANDYLVKPVTLEGWRRTALKIKNSWFRRKPVGLGAVSTTIPSAGIIATAPGA